MNKEKANELREMLECTDLSRVQAGTYVIGRLLLQIALELDRIAETQEEAHK